MAEYVLYCDGSAKHGTGYFGYLLYKDHVQIDYGYGMIGQGIKPKVAEKYSFYYGLDAFIRKWDESGILKVFGDAKQVIEKIEEDSDLLPKIKQIRGWDVQVTFKWVPRDQNSKANDLARKMIEYSRIARTGNRESKG
jgi:ribonuclease HI